VAYDDLNNTHNPAAGTIPPAAWGDQIRDNFEFLIDPPAVSVYNSAVQALTAGNLTVLTADSEFYDNDSMHSTSTNTSRITCVTDGRYMLFATCRFAANTDTTDRLVQLYVNATDSYNLVQVDAPDEANRDCIITATKTLVMTAGDYVEVRARAGASIDVTLEEFTALFLTR